MHKKILFLGFQYCYPNLAGGLGNMYLHFFEPLKKFGEVVWYPLERAVNMSYPQMREDILAVCKKEKPDILFVFIEPFLDERVIAEITATTPIVTVGMFGDDDSGFFTTANKFAKGVFDWQITLYPPAIKWHARLGGKLMGLTGFANPNHYRSLEGIKKDIGVSFVGNASPQRKQFIQKLSTLGVHVECFGNGWPNGMVSAEKMIEIFSRSKINLSLTGTPMQSWWHPKTLARLLIKRRWYDPETGETIDDHRKVVLGKHRYRLVTDFENLFANAMSFRNLFRPCCRGRTVEVAFTRSFQINNRFVYFGKFLEEGKEMVYYDNIKDLVRKIRYYLNADEEREAIAEAAYKKLVPRYTIQAVLERMFATIYDGDPKRPDSPIIILD